MSSEKRLVRDGLRLAVSTHFLLSLSAQRKSEIESPKHQGRKIESKKYRKRYHLLPLFRLAKGSIVVIYE
jgi:hypothetical protein